MNKTLRFSAAARAKISDFLVKNAGVHMPTIGQIEAAIVERLEPVLEHASRDDITGAHLSYHSGSPMSSSYRYQVRGLSAVFTVKARSVDLKTIGVEKLYPKTHEGVSVFMPDEAAGRIQKSISDSKALEARRQFTGLGLISFRAYARQPSAA